MPFVSTPSSPLRRRYDASCDGMDPAFPQMKEFAITLSILVHMHFLCDC